MQENSKNTILAIDIGSSKIHVLIAELTGKLPRIIGWGMCDAKGVQKGIISNIEQASLALEHAVREAKNMAGVEAKKAVVSISSAYVEYTYTNGLVNIKEQEIAFSDIERIMQTCLYNVSLKPDYAPIHVLPYKFVVDDYNVPIEDPKDMNARTMRCNAYTVMAKRAALENLKKVVSNCKVDIQDIVLSSYASSLAVLTSEECKQGVACVDIGAQTCDIMIYNGSSMCYGDYLAVGSGHITSDLAKVLGVTLELAEELKLKYVDMIAQEGDEIRGLNVPRKDAKERGPVPITTLRQIIEARVRETLGLLYDSIQVSGLKDSLGGGIVLTGGMTKLKNLEQYIQQEKIMHPFPVRIATPMGVDGAFDILNDPEMATAVGLVLYGAGYFTNYELATSQKIKVRKSYGMQSSEYNTPIQDFKEGNVQDLQIKEQIIPKKAKQKAQKVDVEANGVQEESENLLKRFWKWLSQLF